VSVFALTSVGSTGTGGSAETVGAVVSGAFTSGVVVSEDSADCMIKMRSKNYIKSCMYLNVTDLEIAKRVVFYA
jgi:hypothetical protein